jgi:hypothetical protein
MATVAKQRCLYQSNGKREVAPFHVEMRDYSAGTYGANVLTIVFGPPRT